MNTLLNYKDVAYLIRLGFRSIGISNRKVKVEGTKFCVNVRCLVAGLDYEKMKKMLLKYIRLTGPVIICAKACQRTARLAKGSAQSAVIPLKDVEVLYIHIVFVGYDVAKHNT